MEIPGLLQDEAVAWVEEHMLTCPELPADLSVGRRLILRPSATALYREEQNPVWGRSTQEVVCMIHKRGIRIYFPSGTDVRIHHSQIIDFLRYEERISPAACTEQGKNPIGRAILGGLAFGPAGAIVGAVSGIGTETVMQSDHIVIYCWDASTKKARALLLCGNLKKRSFEDFVNSANKDLRQLRERTGTRC
jgi:hypothetical protein